nr:reverse transcriptase domain-containing protein [Tanacetum cinerariifolium]
MDDEPVWAADRVAALTFGSTITILETANEFSIKGNDIFLYKTPNRAYQLLEDKVLLKIDWAKNQKTKSSLKKTVAFADEDNPNDQQNNSENPINLDSDDEDDEPTPQPKTRRPKLVKEMLSPKPYKPKILYPQRLWEEKMEAQYKKFLDMIQVVRINVPLVDGLAGMPNYGKFLKELISNKYKIEQISAAFLSDESFANFQNKVPPTLRDPGSFLIPIDVIDEILEEDFDALLDEGSKILYSIEGTVLEEEIFSEFDKFISMVSNENYDSKSNEEESKFEKITINTDYKIKTSLEEPHTDLELKPLPDNLEYVFLEEPSFLPVIISSQLSAQNKSKLVFVLKKMKKHLPRKQQTFLAKCTHPLVPNMFTSRRFLEIFMQQFWYTIKKVQDTDSYEFPLANKKCTVNAKVFRTILDICPIVEGVDFTNVSDDDTLLTLLIDLGYKDLLNKHTNMFMDHMPQP